MNGRGPGDGVPGPGIFTLIQTLISGNKAPSGYGPELFAATVERVVANSFNLFGQKNNPGVASYVTSFSPGADRRDSWIGT